MRITKLGRARDLPVASPASQLMADFKDLPEPGGTHRLSVSETAAIRIERQAAVDLSVPISQEHRLLAMLAKAIFSHMNNFGTGIRILDLNDVDIFWSNSRFLKCSAGRRHCWRRRLARCEAGTENLKRAMVPGSYDSRFHEDRPISIFAGVFCAT
jgi:hypothetical protein